MARVLPRERGEEPLIGWRVWKLRTDGAGSFVLGPAVHGRDGWMPRAASSSSCSRRHFAPDERCRCGLHALRDARDLRRLNWGGTVVGTVALWGRVIEHRRGYRAQSAYPQRLKLVCARCLSEGRSSSAECVVMLALAPKDHRLGLEVVAACADHSRVRSSVRLDVSPRDVEAELLSRYAVEVVPTRSLKTADGWLARVPRRVVRPVRLAGRLGPVLVAGLLLFQLAVMGLGAEAPGTQPNAASDAPPRNLASSAAPSARPTHLSMEAMRLLRNVCSGRAVGAPDPRCAQLKHSVPPSGDGQPPCPVSGSRNMARVLICFQGLARKPG